MRHFGISSAPFYPRVAEKPQGGKRPPQRLGATFHEQARAVVGENQPRGPHAADTRGKLISFPFPPGSIRDDPARAVLETPDLGYALLEIFIGGITGLGLFFAVVLLLLVQT